MLGKRIRLTGIVAAMVVVTLLSEQPLSAVTFESLLREMADRDALATFPAPRHTCLQASSYNRLSVARDQPNQGTGGWFADSDGIGFIRTEMIDGRQEWVVMEHTGPGALTRFWTPFFYYGFKNRTGPHIRIYLDGSTTPVIDENFIELLSNLDWSTSEYGDKPTPQNTVSLPEPFASFTARAGVLHLPIPFAKSCKVTMTGKPFYNTISYRAYPAGTTVQTFTTADLSSPGLAAIGKALTAPTDFAAGTLLQKTAPVPAGGELALALPAGTAAIRHLEIDLDAAAVEADPTILRALILSATFDGEERVWCPVGDFFCSPARLNDLATWTRQAIAADGRFVCRWVMPYETSGSVRLRNLGGSPVTAGLKVRTGPWTWDDHSLHFHATWRADDIVPGTPFLDWNFIDIQGKGVLVGDAWTVLNLTTGWWGEGDEKIYVDDDYEGEKFPSQFGTGTEDYYGWAGGVNPTRNDVFATPYEANVQVGSTTSNSSQGFNVNTRTRALDAIPFDRRLVFDMEASAGTGQRNAWDLLMYSSVVYWYARPGAITNRPPPPAAALRPISSFAELQARSKHIRNGGTESANLTDSQPGVFTVVGDYDFADNRIPVGFTAVGDPSCADGKLLLDGDGDYLQAAAPTTATDNIVLEALVSADRLGAFNFATSLSSAASGNSGYGLVAQHGNWNALTSGVGFPGSAPHGAVPTPTVAIAYVRESGDSALYVNGVKRDSGGGDGPILLNKPGLITIGGHAYDIPRGLFSGSIDRVRVSTFTGAFTPKDLLGPGDGTAGTPDG